MFVFLIITLFFCTFKASEESNLSSVEKSPISTRQVFEELFEKFPFLEEPVETLPTDLFFFDWQPDLYCYESSNQFKDTKKENLRIIRKRKKKEDSAFRFESSTKRKKRLSARQEDSIEYLQNQPSFILSKALFCKVFDEPCMNQFEDRVKVLLAESQSLEQRRKLSRLISEIARSYCVKNSSKRVVYQQKETLMIAAQMVFSAFLNVPFTDDKDLIQDPLKKTLLEEINR